MCLQYITTIVGELVEIVSVEMMTQDNNYQSKMRILGKKGPTRKKGLEEITNWLCSIASD